MQAIWLGRRRYLAVDALQRALFDARRAGAVVDTLLFTEFEPVVTLGRGAKPAHLLASAERLEALGIELARVDRGGDVTLHGPGQLVCYPILHLPAGRRDVRRYVQDLTEVMRRVVEHQAIAAGAFRDLIGLWANTRDPTRWAPDEPGCTAGAAGFAPAKLGAVGVRLSRWVTMHGFALNLTISRDLFGHIVPCGIANYPVTSIQSLSGRSLPAALAAEHARRSFAQLWQVEVLPLRDAAHVTDAQLSDYCLADGAVTLDPGASASANTIASH